MHQIHFLLGLCPRPRCGAYSAPRPLPLFKGPTSKGWRETGEGEEKVKGKEGERWREGFGPPKNFDVAPLMGSAPDSIEPLQETKEDTHDTALD